MGYGWKVTFTTLKWIFESTVIFYGLINSPVTFQMMINKILQDIDNVIIEIEEEKDHDKIVEEVVRRLVENDLYMKPKKYKWKIY